MSNAIVITGMHRSGTSLVSNLLHVAGANMGERWLAANSANPRGFFEDVDFYEFHEQALHARKQSYLYLDPHFVFDPTPAERERAEQLVAKRSRRPLWGWKDPRTALFLTFWQQLLPDTRFVFVYRHPLEVVVSLLRRGEFDSHPLLSAGLHAWKLYNSKIKQFYARHPEQCVLVHIDSLVGQPSLFAKLLHEKLELDLLIDAEAFQNVYHAEDLHKSPLPPEVAHILHKIAPQSLELYQELNRRADLPADSQSAESAASPQFAALASFAESVHGPAGLSVEHGLLQLVLALLSPDPSETMLRRFYRSANGAQQTIDTLWLHAQRLERMNTEQCETLQRQQAQLETQRAQLEMRDFQLQSHSLPLQAQSVQLQAQTMQLQEQALQIQRQHHELHQQGARIQSLLAELSRVYGTRAGKMIRAFWRFQERWQKKRA